MIFEQGLEDEIGLFMIEKLRGRALQAILCVWGLAWLEYMVPVFPGVEVEDDMVSYRIQGQSRELVWNPMFKWHHIR